MNLQFTYEVILHTEPEGGYSVTFPDFSEAFTQGDSVEEALEEAQDCLDEAVANRIDMDLDIPIPKNLNEEGHLVSLTSVISYKAALYIIVREEELKNVKLADMLGCDEKAVRRLLDPHQNTRLPVMDKALRQLGAKPVNVFIRTA